MRTFFRLAFVLTLLCIFSIVRGQPPRGPWVISPQVNPDKTVTFRYLAPLVKEVKLSAQFLKEPVAMIKDSIGIWSVTVGPVIPDIYPYNFIAAGVSVMDPANVACFPNERFKASLIDIPADTPLVHAMQNVPHGTITYEYYPSVDGTTGTLLTYTPPGYNKDPLKKYPVFYLISGTTDTEETFFKVGRVNLILDNLIARGEVEPMIVVMPYGNVAARVAEQNGEPKPADPKGRESAEALARSRAFENDLIHNIIPYIEKNYQVISKAEYRAIGGFSRGGGQTLRTAFGNPDKFAWVCCYSAYLSKNEIESNYKYIIDTPEKTNNMFKLLWVSVGNDDFLYNPTIDFMDYLQSKNINYVRLITPGGHTWMNVKTYLAATIPLLFK